MNLLTLFRDAKITHKLTTAVVALIVGFASLAIAYLKVLDADQGAFERAQRLNEYGALVDQVAIGVLQARRREKDFMLRDDPKYVDLHAKRMARIQKNLAELQDLAPDKAQLDLAARVDAQLAEYDDKFKQMVSDKIKLGLDENSGLHGAMRQAVHDVEDRANQFDNAVLGRSMLMMRRHEKDFIQRGKERYIQKMADQQAIFARLLKAAKLPADAKREIAANMAKYHQTFSEFAAGTQRVKESVAVFRDAVHKVEPLLRTMTQAKDTLLAAGAAKHEAERSTLSYLFFAAIVLIGALVSGVLILAARSIMGPVGRLMATVQEVADGDFGARTQIDTRDELGQLGMAFDKLLNDRVAALAEVEKENERLNNSIIELIRAVSDISNKDFTVRVPVKEDVTGAVGDSLNLLMSEMTKIITEVRRISRGVASVSTKVKQQSDMVISVAGDERLKVEETAQSLDTAARTMNQIAGEAQTANDRAERTIQNTQAALERVTQTVDGINVIRDTISETEKRIKRLGERSQEITGIVNLINSIAERTHILALNASMHAASAGEAGRGFAVVADEVQRLAENAREATSEISTLVNNIRVETADTVNTMNKVISHVADGTKLAEQAGETMKRTQAATTELVSSVKQIAADSLHQADTSNVLSDRAGEIQDSSRKTAKLLQEQGRHTANLVKFSDVLVKVVSVFRLPDPEEQGIKVVSGETLSTGGRSAPGAEAIREAV